MENQNAQQQSGRAWWANRVLVIVAIAALALAILSCSSPSPADTPPPVVSPESATQYVDTVARAVERGDRTQVEALAAKRNGDFSDFVEWAIYQPELVVECLRNRRYVSSTPSYHVFSYSCGDASGTFRVYQHNAEDGVYSDEGIRFE